MSQGIIRVAALGLFALFAGQAAAEPISLHFAGALTGMGPIQGTDAITLLPINPIARDLSVQFDPANGSYTVSPSGILLTGPASSANGLQFMPAALQGSYVQKNFGYGSWDTQFSYVNQINISFIADIHKTVTPNINERIFSVLNLWMDMPAQSINFELTPDDVITAFVSAYQTGASFRLIEYWVDEFTDQPTGQLLSRTGEYYDGTMQIDRLTLPEPASFTLLGLGLISLGYWHRRKRA